MKRHFQYVEQVKSPSNITKYCACHAKCMSSLICVTYETSLPMRGASQVTLQPHQIVRRRRYLQAPDFSGNSLNASANRKTIRTHPTTIRTQNRHLAPAASETLLVPSWRRFCIIKYNISRSGYLPKCHDVLRLPRKVTLQPHQILRLPRKMNLLTDLRHI